jgi:hypothetical protein
MNLHFVFSSCLMLSLVVGCSKPQQDPSVPPVPVAPASKVSDTAPSQPTSHVGGERSYEYSDNITFDIPESWREDPNPSMVDSRYFIKTSEGELQLTLTSMGGGLNQNIERWVKQVKTAGEGASRDNVTIAGVSCPRVDVRGDYNNRVGADKGNKENWRLIGIGVPNSSRDFFVKLVGPRDGINEFKEEFEGFLKSGRFAK